MSRFFDQLAELAGVYPINDQFIERLRQRVIQDCSKVPVQVHKPHRAERRLELAACESIALFWQESHPDAWFPITMRPNWPRARCILIKNKAVISISIGPETEGEQGGQEIEPVEFPVIRTPPNIISKAFQAFTKRDQKAEREKEFAPIGTPDFKPELKLNTPLPPAKPKQPEVPKARKLPAKATLKPK